MSETNLIKDFKDIMNESYLPWLRFANAGMLGEDNIVTFDYAISNLTSDSPMIEIGSFCGLSANVQVLLKRLYGKTNPLFCSDPWVFEGGEREDFLLGQNSPVRNRDYRRFVQESYLRNVSFFSQGDLPYPVEGTSDSFFQKWDAREYVTDLFGRVVQLGGPICFAYVDGDHTLPVATRDFENIDKWLETDGFIFFDDTDEADVYGWKLHELMNEIQNLSRYELVRKHPNCLFRKISQV